MKEPPEIAAELSPTGNGGRPSNNFPRWRGFILATVVLVLGFSIPLYDLVVFAAHSELYSHILLIPLVSLYLVWLRKHSLPARSAPARRLAATFFIGGFGMLALYWFTIRSFAGLNDEDYLAMTVFSFFLLFIGVSCVFLGKATLRTLAFPISFLIFIVPFPTFLLDGIEVFLQYGSAAAANVMFKLAGTPVVQNGLAFPLSNITLFVAPECSGIHSTLVLFIVSLVAGHLFLRSPSKRIFLTLVVIPLAVLRNGFRIFTIGELCVHVGPHMIYSYIHRHGGPIFFVLSLVPFFLLLYFLRKSDCGKKAGTSSQPEF